jgi:hypothetical protein
MSTESEEKKESAACCDPEKFQGMFGMMGKCFPGEKTPDCSAFMESMKKGGCCTDMMEMMKKKMSGESKTKDDFK